MKSPKIIITMLLCATTALAQKSVTNVLATMPNDIAPYINDSQREEIGKLNAGTDSLSIKNGLNGYTTVKITGRDFATIELNKNTDMQVKLLTANDSSQVICVVKTVKHPIAESEINFYTADWIKTGARYNLPDTHDANAMLDELTARPDSMPGDEFEQLRKNLEPVVVNAGFDSNGEKLTFNLSIPFADKATINDMKTIIKQKSFKWNGKVFNIY